MSAPKENQFWRLRSRHGRNKLFESPELMWEAACEYFEWCEENPFFESKPMVTSNGGNEGSSIEMAQIPIKRPFTLQGLCLYLDCTSSYFRGFKNQERAQKDDFMSVIGKIEETIFNQQFSGAASGFLNANIIARSLGLKDSTDITSGGDKINQITQVEIVHTNEDQGNSKP